MHCFFRRWWSPTPKHPRQQPAPQYTLPHPSYHHEGGPKQWQNSWLRRPFRSRGAMKKVRPRRIAFWSSLRGWSTNYNYWLLLFLCFLFLLFINLYYLLFLFIIVIYISNVAVTCWTTKYSCLQKFFLCVINATRSR